MADSIPLLRYAYAMHEGPDMADSIKILKRVTMASQRLRKDNRDMHNDPY